MSTTKPRIIDIAKTQPVILYDGVCALCNGFIKWIIKFDRDDQFRFMPLQEVPGELLDQDLENLQTVVLLYQGETYLKSDAALKSAGLLGGLWKGLKVFNVVPKGIRNFVYDTVAKYRYKWFGQYEACPIPDPEIRHKFLHMQ